MQPPAVPSAPAVPLAHTGVNALCPRLLFVWPGGRGARSDYLPHLQRRRSLSPHGSPSLCIPACLWAPPPGAGLAAGEHGFFTVVPAVAVHVEPMGPKESHWNADGELLPSNHITGGARCAAACFCGIGSRYCPGGASCPSHSLPLVCCPFSHRSRGAPWRDRGLCTWRGGVSGARLHPLFTPCAFVRRGRCASTCPAREEAPACVPPPPLALLQRPS